MGRTRDAKLWELWRGRLLRFESLNQTIAEFCRWEGVSQAAFYLWRKKLQDEAPGKKQNQRPLFVPVMSAVRSVTEHLQKTLVQYQDLITEIESSALTATDKKELLDSLNAKLNTDTLYQKRESAQDMMESAIWEIRFRKARTMAKKKTDAAVSYLRNIRLRTDSHRILLQIDALIRELNTTA